MGYRNVWKLLKDAFGAWREDHAPSMGAAASYYTMFSIAPLRRQWRTPLHSTRGTGANQAQRRR